MTLRRPLPRPVKGSGRRGGQVKAMMQAHATECARRETEGRKARRRSAKIKTDRLPPPAPPRLDSTLHTATHHTAARCSRILGHRLARGLARQRGGAGASTFTGCWTRAGRGPGGARRPAEGGQRMHPQRGLFNATNGGDPLILGIEVVGVVAVQHTSLLLLQSARNENESAEEKNGQRNMFLYQNGKAKPLLRQNFVLPNFCGFLLLKLLWHSSLHWC